MKDQRSLLSKPKQTQQNNHIFFPLDKQKGWQRPQAVCVGLTSEIVLMYVDVVWKHCSNGRNGRKKTEHGKKNSFEYLKIVMVLVHAVHESRHTHNIPTHACKL